MSQTANPTDELTPEQVQALGELSEMAAGLTRSLRKMKEACQFSLAASPGPLAYAREKLAEVKRLQGSLNGKGTQAEQAYAGMALTIMARMLEPTVAMLELQEGFDRKNLALAQQGLEMVEAAGADPNAWVQLAASGQLEAYRFIDPTHDMRYLEARAQASQYVGLHHWMAGVDGIDAILRVAVDDRAVACQSPEEEAGRQAIADALRSAMAGDRELALFVGQTGTQLHEAFGYFQWAAQALKNLADKPPEGKKAALQDPEWKKLHAKAVFLSGLIQRVQAYPALAEFFPAYEAPELPFTELEWRDELVAPPSGTGRLGTGRLAGQTGRLAGR